MKQYSTHCPSTYLIEIIEEINNGCLLNQFNLGNQCKQIRFINMSPLGRVVYSPSIKCEKGDFAFVKFARQVCSKIFSHFSIWVQGLRNLHNKINYLARAEYGADEAMLVS
jgi:hypothetical protein